MKKKNRSLLILTIAVSLVVGFLTGMLVDFPKTDNTQLSGTIGRVQNYKNVKVTEKDIELKNDLVSDTVMLKALSAWFNYYYVSAVSQGDKIRYALDQIQPLETYKEYAGVVLSDVAGYRTFLENTRTNLLLAVAMVRDPAEIHPVLLRNTIVEANNVISRMSHRKQSVLDLIDNMGSYLEAQGSDPDGTLAGLHTVLTMDQLANAMALNDKMVIRYFQKKKLFTDEIQGSFGLNLKEIVVEDLSRLNAINDQSALNLLIILDQDNIGSSQIVSDAALIGQQFLLNETALQFYCSNMSELGYINKSSSTLENMQDLALGGVMFIMDATGELGGFFNMENLKGTGSFDKANLGSVGFFNAQQLGFLNVSQLGAFMDKVSNLGGITSL
ncbi:MAG: hypothetical protein PHR05_08130 [Bacteroidales bacterium]|jgi:hypothetical protein|nr:hypothetical protein [Bacteroidales bacterium]